MNDYEIIYKYLDESIKNIREEALKDYLINSNAELLSFTDLSLYEKKDDFKSSVKNILMSSKINQNITLSSYQIEILNLLMEKNNVFLSAPTSFGKTFLMLEYIYRNMNNLQNVIFIIPTLALMNELLDKIYNIFNFEYNICINGKEIFGERNIFVFVPERCDQEFFEKISSLEIDLLVFDEIYKLQCKKEKLYNDDRVIYMNKVYLDLVEKSKQIVLLGPFIKDVNFDNTKLNIVKYFSNFIPVYNEILFVDNDEIWIQSLSFNKELVYFSSPESIYKNIELILKNVKQDRYFEEIYEKEIKHLSENISEDWYVIELLKRGIGIHHGKTPMFLRKFIESEYNHGPLNVILCTDTLLEGINTPTQSLIIVDTPDTPFKLNNLIGRVGRLNPKRPQIGKIVICNENTKELLKNSDMWLSLNIMAEDKNVISDDEVLYLRKEHQDKEKKKALDKKINYLQKEWNINKDNLVKNNVKMKEAYDFFSKNIYGQMFEQKDLYGCVVKTAELLKAPHYYFETTKFENLYIDGNFKYLPYKVYISDLLMNKSISEIVANFNARFNRRGNKKNINLIIDALYELDRYIKFKFSKIVNYLSLVDNYPSNKQIDKFIGLISGYHNLEVVIKLLEDIGIEREDAPLIIETLQLTNEISASILIDKLKRNKQILFSKKLSPFSKHNINNL